MPPKKPQQKKKKKKKPPQPGEGGGDAGAGADDDVALAVANTAAATDATLAPVEETWLDFQKRELARLTDVVRGDPDWIAFGIGRAPFVPFSVDPDINAAFNDSRCWQTDSKAISLWMNRAESSVIFFILQRIIERPGRADLFRSLGRGWVFVMLDRPKRRFKWWFESVQQLVKHHPNEILALDLRDAQLEKCVPRTRV